MRAPALAKGKETRSLNACTTTFSVWDFLKDQHHGCFWVLHNKESKCPCVQFKIWHWSISSHLQLHLCLSSSLLHSVYSFCCDGFHITSLAAPGEVLAAQTVLALKPLETSISASDLRKHFEQKGRKLFAKNRFVEVVQGFIWSKLPVPKICFKVLGESPDCKPGQGPEVLASLYFGRKSLWMEGAGDAVVCPHS